MTEGRSQRRLEAALTELTTAIIEVAGEGVRQDHDPPRLLSMAEAGEVLGISKPSLYKLLDSGQLRSIKVGARRLIPSGAIQELVDAHGG